MPFNELAFQPRARAILTRALGNERLAHAYLFVGPQGAGKLLAARIFAQAINCQSGGERPCGTCTSCDQIERGMDPDRPIHPDLWHVLPGRFVGPDGRQQASHTILIDAIRELCGRLYGAPLSAQRRIVLIHEADTMQITAQNAFLKTLEEPMERLRTVFILLTSRPKALLPTIHSRAQVVRFGYVSPGALAQMLAQEGLGEDDEERLRLAELAGGSLSEARRLAQDPDALATRQDWLRSWHGCVAERGAGAAELAERIGRSREDFDAFLKLLIAWHRDLLLVKSGISEGLVNTDCREWLMEEAKRWSAETISARATRISGLQQAQETFARGDLALLSLLYETSL